MNKQTFSFVLVLIVLMVLAVGIFIGRSLETDLKNKNVRHVTANSDPTQTVWTCAMHPGVEASHFGKCRICGMDLILKKTDDNLSGGLIMLSKTALSRAQVETQKVKREYVTKNIRLVGKVKVDQTHLTDITARVDGRINRLYVDYTGVPVVKGDHLVELYSPDLITTQHSLISAKNRLDKANTTGDVSGIKRAKDAYDSVKQRLILWGVTEEQVDAIVKQETPFEQITLYTSKTGIVLEKHIVEGAYVKEGTPIYTIANLSQLWVLLDVYESDLSWMRYGQEVTFETEAYKGKVFSGTIAFIDPILNDKSRTVKIRVNVNNKDGLLKPDMFVRALVKAQMNVNGEVLNIDLANKWICPMHPEVVAESEGRCVKCDMKLEKAETLDFVNGTDVTAQAPLVIPVSAPLITGKRAIVYVAHPSIAGSFDLREVVLGPRAGDHYIVKDGLAEGERVVTRGNFKIDSEVQLSAKGGMMHPKALHHDLDVEMMPMPMPAPMPKKAKDHIEEKGEWQTAVGQFYAHYIPIQKALVNDDLANAQATATAFLNVVSGQSLFMHHAYGHDNKGGKLRGSLKGIAGALSLNIARDAFEILSKEMTQLITTNGINGDRNVYQYYCSMAFDNKGALWLQDTETTSNAYFGASMLRCGSQKDVLYESGR